MGGAVGIELAGEEDTRWGKASVGPGKVRPLQRVEGPLTKGASGNGAGQARKGTERLRAAYSQGLGLGSPGAAGRGAVARCQIRVGGGGKRPWRSQADKTRGRRFRTLRLKALQRGNGPRTRAE